MGFTKAQLETTYGVPVYIHWYRVPSDLHARNWFKKNHGIDIPKDAKPDGIKGGCNWKTFYFLFKEEKYLTEDLRTKIEPKTEPETIERPKLKVNFENG